MKIIAQNKKARYDYELIQIIEAGIELKGSEIKSIREGKVSLKESYIQITNNLEIRIINMNITNFQKNKFDDLSENRTRKLLLHKKEIIKLKSEIQISGYTIVPTKIYIKNGKAKLEIALAKGKKLYDKRNSIREKELNRKVQKELKYY